MRKQALRFTQDQVATIPDHLSRGSNFQTNFAVAGKNQGWESRGFFHSEQLLLRHLDAMLGFTMANTGNQCPSHIVIYTLNAPCFLPGRDPTGCTEQIFRTFDRVKSFTCRGTNTKYVLGYRYDPGREDFRQNWTKGKSYLEVRGITVVRINL